MAKMFYSLEEAAERLGKSTDEVRALAESGQLQEFRDRERLMFKREQVDLIAGDGGEEISLADDLEPITLSSSGSGSAMSFIEDTKEGTGISIFDVEGTEEADPSAATVMSETAGQTSPDFSIDPAASGSGLLDLTREADDTSLGEDLLQDVYGDSGDAGGSVAGDDSLFETTGADADVSNQPVMAMAVAERVDGTWSGMAGGLALGMVLSTVAAVALIVLVISGMAVGSSGAAPGDAATGGLVSQIAGNFYPVVGGLAGATVLFAIIGMVIGKKTA